MDMDKDLLEAIGQMMEEKLDKKLKPITERLDRLQADVDKLKEDVSELKESHEVTRDGVNALLEWSDKISEAQRLPLPKI